MRLAEPRQNSRRNKQDDKDGIALIVVLGMLSVLALMAVAFAISMRTERMAASSFADVVRARNLMDAALGRTITEHIPTAQASDFYPNWTVFPPRSGTPGNNFMAAKGSNYVPGVLIDSVRPRDIIEWIDIIDPQDNRFYGQYSYLVVNQSGLLDANIVAESNRVNGLHPAEISVNSDIFEEATFDPNTQQGGRLRDWRGQFIRFETVPELYSLGVWQADTIAQTIITNPPPFLPLHSFYVDHFHVFSHYPQGSWISYDSDPVVRPQNFVGLEPDEWSDEVIEAIVRNLTSPPNAPFLEEEDAESFVDMLIDYATPTYVPRNPAGPSFKRVPMLNEIVVSNTFVRLPPDATFTNDQVQLRVHVDVETFYPFRRPASPRAFRVHYSGTPIVVAISPTHDVNDLGELTLQNIQDPLDPGDNPHDQLDYRVTRFTFASDPVEINDNWDGMAIGLQIDPGTIQVTLREDTDAVVNQVSGWEPNDFRFIFGGFAALTAYDEPATVGPPQRVGRSADDPRLNWNASPTAGQWRGQAITLGEPNSRAGLSPQPTDEVMRPLYCRQGQLRSAAELSFLLYSGDPANPFQPWRTLRLLGPDPNQSARLLDRFTVVDPSVESHRRGKVNINTPHANVLAAALAYSPVRATWLPQGTPPRGAVTVDEARLIADRIIAGLPSAGARNLSALAAIPDLQTTDIVTLLDLPENDKFVAESFVRHSHGLLGTRHTLYTAFLITRVFPRGFDPDPSRSEIDIPPGLTIDDMVVAEQRAVAVIWRDPGAVTGAGGDGSASHRSLIRTFIWLTEED